MRDKSKNQICYILSNKRRPKVRFFVNFKKTSNTKRIARFFLQFLKPKRLKIKGLQIFLIDESFGK